MDGTSANIDAESYGYMQLHTAQVLGYSAHNLRDFIALRIAGITFDEVTFILENL